MINMRQIKTGEWVSIKEVAEKIVKDVFSSVKPYVWEDSVESYENPPKQKTHFMLQAFVMCRFKTNGVFGFQSNNFKIIPPF